jgi:hypothetical protein
MNYLVACECGNKIEVSQSQAGGEVTCDCGQVVAVPSLLKLRQLETVEVETVVQKKSNWGSRQSVMFIGTIVVLFGVGLVVVFLSSKPVPPADIIKTGMIEESFGHFTLLQTYQSWEMLQKGVGYHRPIDKKFVKANKKYKIRQGLSGSVLLAGLIIVGIGLCLPKPRGCVNSV